MSFFLYENRGQVIASKIRDVPKYTYHYTVQSYTHIDNYCKMNLNSILSFDCTKKSTEILLVTKYF